ncbi:MAG TPA: hypothetical protein VHB68_15775 [Steroidobacteraceae bacterium]|nr:hypothetical protein [Steroidobacteraceae bacterium]
MKLKVRLSVLGAVLALSASLGALADEAPLHPRNFVTTHTGTFGGTALTYVTTAGDTILTDAHGAPAAALFSFSYVRQGVKDAANRPVLFIFNGGPGSSSLWIHMGVLGPRRIAADDPAHPVTVGPFHTVDNPLSVLDIADLVFIDPVGTGFSHVVGAGKTEDYYGVTEDARATAQFVVAWLTKNHRWNSPKYVLGESYGTTRAAVLAKALAGGPFGGGNLPGVSLNGIVLLGVHLGGVGEDAAIQSLLPSLAATAWYHGRIDKKGRTFDAFLSEVQQFAAGDYGAALYAGSRLPEPQRQAIAAQLAAYTGLSASFVLEHHLRVSSDDFAGELLRDRGLDVGKYDARYTLAHAGSGGDPVADDPAMGQYSPGFIATFNEYLESDLAVTLEQRYEVIAFAAVNSRWNWGHGTSEAHGPELAAAMRRTPGMRLMVGSGYYDLVTPFAQARYQIDHTDAPLDRVAFKNYESGHMAYLGEAAARAFAQDLRDFIRR